MRIEDFKTDVELRHRVVLGPRAHLVKAVVGTAAVTKIRPHRGKVADDPRDRSGAYGAGHQRGIENPGRFAVVIDAGIAAEPRRLPARVPNMLIGGEYAPRTGQLYCRSGSEDPVDNPDDADAGRGVVDLGNCLPGAEPDGALGVARVNPNHVAARQVELAASRPVQPSLPRDAR